MNKLLFVVFMSLSLGTFAQFNTPQVQEQASGDGRISGVLIDSVSKAPVEFATISLFRSSDLVKPVDGTMTDDKGKFALKNLQNGRYTLKLTSIGYTEKIIRLEAITDKNNNINLGDVVLSSSAQMLKEITVTGQAAVIEEKVDRLVYNADKDLSSKGGDAGDVLRKVPLLTVDLDGNVQLRGSSNIRVLINNKPSTILAASLADALKQIPADQIKTVEVITSPSAKYDAEGSGGIINIITKKNNIEGYTLNVDMGAGNRGGNLGLNGSLRTGKLGLNLGGFGRGNFNPSYSEFEQITKNGESLFVTKQTSDSKDRNIFGRYSLGADYDISKNKSINAGARFGTRSSSRNQELNIDQFFDGIPAGSSLRQVNSNNPSMNWDFNLDYLHVIKPQQEFSLSTLYSINSLNNDFTTKFLNQGEASNLPFENVNKNLNQELTFQADYQTPIGKNQLVEVGGKGIFRFVDSEYSYRVNGQTISDPKRPAGSLDYNQNIAAAYLAYTISTKSKYTFKAGTRYEYTDISASQTQAGIAGATDIEIPGYHNFVPSVNVSKTFGGKYTVKLGYNRRIQRPGLQQLNPNYNIANPQNIQVGNPLLRPEVADNVELGVSASIKKIYVNMSVFGRTTNSSISQVRVPIDSLEGAIVTTYQNIGKEKALGLNWFGNLTITPKWTLNGGIEAFYNFMNGQTVGLDGLTQTTSNEGWNLNGRLMTMVSLPNGWQVQAFSFARGSRVQLQGRTGGFGFYSIGVRKEFKNKKGSIGLSGENFFTRYMKIRSSLESPLFTQNSVNYMYNSGVRVNFSYRIGKMGMDAMSSRKKSRSVNNDDIKEGGGDNNNSGQQNQQQGGGMPAGGGNRSPRR